MWWIASLTFFVIYGQDNVIHPSLLPCSRWHDQGPNPNPNPSNVCSWKTSCSGNIHSWSEALPHKNVINLDVVLSIWAMPCPSSGCFVMIRCVRQHKVVKGGKLQKSESSLICVISAEGSTNALPVSTSIPAHFCIPVSLYNKNVLLRCLINDIL